MQDPHWFEPPTPLETGTIGLTLIIIAIIVWLVS